MNEQVTQEKKTIGRPTEYTQEKGLKICEKITQGFSLKSIVENDESLPSLVSIYSWLSNNEDFLNNYARATEQRTEAQLEDLNILGDISIQEAKDADPKSSNAIVSAYKLKADNMKWVMARMKPKKYGDKIDMTSDGKAITVELISYKKEAKE